MPESSQDPEALGTSRIERLELVHGHRFAVHRHDQGHLTYAASGVLSVSTRDGTSIAPSTRVAWTPAGFDHHHAAHGSTDMRLLFLAPRREARLPSRPTVFVVSPLAREAMLTLTADEPDARPQAALERLREVVIDELVLAPEQPLHLPEPHDDRLRAITALLHDDPGNTDTLAALGHRVGAGERTLSRLFHDEVGMTFRQWRGQLRLHHSLTLLASGRPVTDVAAACGWSNPTSFIEAFTAVLGETPGRYRARMRG